MKRQIKVLLNKRVGEAMNTIEILILRSSIIAANIFIFFYFISFLSDSSISKVIKDSNMRVSVVFYLAVGYASGMLASGLTLLMIVALESLILLLSFGYAFYLVRR